VTRVRFIPQADAEVAWETRYYRREAGPTVAQRFVRALEEATRLAREFPDAGSPGTENTRHIQLKGFPFSIVYRRVPEGILVFALAANAREPRYWVPRTTQG